MSRITSSDFVGTRARFQRIRDSKIFNGWIESFFGNRLEVSTATDHAVMIGDEFRFEGFGHMISVVFLAKLEAIGTFDDTMGRSAQIAGSQSQIVEAHRTTLRLVVSSPMRYANSPEAVRYKIKQMYAPVTVGSKTIEAFALDVSPAGIGLTTDEQIEPQTNVTVCIHTGLGKVTAPAVCRHSRPDEDRPGKFRAGFMFFELSRLDKPKWERFIKELV